jgi:hypothetical protein
MATIGGGGKGRVIACWRELLALVGVAVTTIGGGEGRLIARQWSCWQELPW